MKVHVDIFDVGPTDPKPFAEREKVAPTITIAMHEVMREFHDYQKLNFGSKAVYLSVSTKRYRYEARKVD